MLVSTFVCYGIGTYSVYTIRLMVPLEIFKVPWLGVSCNAGVTCKIYLIYLYIFVGHV